MIIIRGEKQKAKTKCEFRGEELLGPQASSRVSPCPPAPNHTRGEVIRPPSQIKNNSYSVIRTRDLDDLCCIRCAPTITTRPSRNCILYQHKLSVQRVLKYRVGGEGQEVCLTKSAIERFRSYNITQRTDKTDRNEEYQRMSLWRTASFARAQISRVCIGTMLHGRYHAFLPQWMHLLYIDFFYFTLTFHQTRRLLNSICQINQLRLVMYVAVLIHERNIFHLLFVYKKFHFFCVFFFHLKDLVLK